MAGTSGLNTLKMLFIRRLDKWPDRLMISDLLKILV